MTDQDGEWLERRKPSLTQEQVQSAMAAAIREVLADEKVTEKFWEKGYKQMEAYFFDNSSKWIGKRVLASIATALLGFGLYLLGKSSGIK